MLSAVHPLQTRRLASDQDEYNALSIADRPEPELGNVMESIWEPTPRELEELKNGGFIRLSIIGLIHPPVMLDVVPRSED